MKLVLFGLSLAICAVVYRLVPHPSNVTPIAALSLLAISQFSCSRSGWALFLPIVALLISDVFLGFYSGVEFVYAGHVLAALCGLGLRQWSLPRFASVVMSSALVFFVVSNFGVWAMTPLYTKSFSGLVECYVAALPFLKLSLAGDLLFASVFFGAYRVCGFSMRSPAQSIA
jgi:hypothetical protein